jgi:hypothetical protein
MTEEDMVKLHVKISSKVLAEFKQELQSEYGTITQDILNKEVAAAITGYTKAKKLKLIGTG